MESNMRNILLGRRIKKVIQFITIAMLASVVIVALVRLIPIIGEWLYGQNGQLIILLLLIVLSIVCSYEGNGVLISVLMVAIPVYGLVVSGAWFHWPIGDLPPSFLERFVLEPFHWAISYGVVLGITGHLIGLGLRQKSRGLNK